MNVALPTAAVPRREPLEAVNNDNALILGKATYTLVDQDIFASMIH